MPSKDNDKGQSKESYMELSENSLGNHATTNNFSVDTSVYVRSSDSIDICLKKAFSNGGNNFNLFIKSNESRSIPKADPRKIKKEIMEKVSQFAKIDNLRYNRNGSILLSTRDVECAIQISQVSTLMGVSTKCSVIWENISTRFLIYDIPTDMPLNELAQDLMAENKIEILELRRFMKKGSSNEFSPVLVTIFGTKLPDEIKIWFTVQKVKLFVDRVRQCKRCKKFNHGEARCKYEQACINCGGNHSDLCHEKPKCANCGGEHRADYRQCPQRIRESEFLQFKCRNFLSFIDARRKFKAASNTSTYAKQVSSQVSDVEMVKQFELRTNNLLKVFCDVVAKNNEKVTEALNNFTVTLKNFLTSFEDSCSREPTRKKQDLKLTGMTRVKIPNNG